MRWKRGFILFVVLWTVVTLPGLAPGFAYAGGDVRAMLLAPDVQTIDLAVWVVSMLWLFSPVLLAPFANERGRVDVKRLGMDIRVMEKWQSYLLEAVAPS